MCFGNSKELIKIVLLSTNNMFWLICFLFGLILYVPVNSFSVMTGSVFLGLISTKQRIKCLAQGHNKAPTVRLMFWLKKKSEMSQCLRFPTMWYVRPAKPQISLRIRTV